MNLRGVLSKDEVRDIMQRSNWKALWEVSFTWGVIIATFAMVAIWTNVFTIILALILLGGRQLALAIIMHDTAHFAVFKTKQQNIVVGQWLAAYPLFQNLLSYRDYHLEHHQNTGTEKDPDLGLTTGYPTTKASFSRKVGRDLAGVSGFKAYYGLYLMYFGYLKYTLGGMVIQLNQEGKRFIDRLKSGYHNLWGPAIMNGLMLAVFFAIGKPWLYLLWIGAMMTTYMLFLRIRSIAEHAITPDKNDPLNNTRTTYAKWYEKLLFAPHNVHYHLEHHLMPSVPSYNLPRLHRMFKERGVLDNACVETSYWNVLTKAWGAAVKPAA